MLSIIPNLLERNANVQKILLAVSLVFLCGCKTLENAPITHFYVIDTDNGACSKRQITDKKTLASVRVATLPIEQCDGVWGISAQEYLDLRTYLKQQE